MAIILNYSCFHAGNSTWNPTKTRTIDLQILHLLNFFCHCTSVLNQTYMSRTSKQLFSLNVQSLSSSVICQTTGPKPLAKRFHHIVRSTASSFNSQYPLLSLWSSSNFLRLLPCLLVTFICPFIFPSITCLRRQFLRKKCPISTSPVSTKKN